jgi:hypothetical protein
MDGVDFSMPSMAFDSNDLSMLIVDYPMEHEMTPLPGTADRRQGDRDEGARRFSYENFSATGTTASTSTGIPSWPTTQAGFSEGSLEFGRDQEADVAVSDSSVAEDARTFAKSHKELLKLSLELVEDRERMDSQAPWPPRPPITPNPLKCSSSIQQQPVNRMLDQASRLWDILKDLSATSDTPKPRPGGPGYENGVSNHLNGSSDRPRQGYTRPSNVETGYPGNNGNLASRSFSPPPSSSATRSLDPLLIANLVTTYVCLLRSCRAVFARLYHALLMAPTSEVNSLISLPGLQFGNFPLENNLAIQVKVLIELTSGMLLRISNALGISPASVIGGSSSPTPNEDVEHRLPFLSDPVAISIRQIILSQELMQNGAQDGEPPPLTRIIKNIQTLLERRYCPLSLFPMRNLFIIDSVG